MNNYMAVVEYDGTYYKGFQTQPGEVRTVQGELIKVLSAVLKKFEDFSYSGRTDTGVHALNQVINFKTDKDLDLYKFKWQLNCLLPDDIGIREINLVGESFNSRRSARLREYSYFIVNNNSCSVFLKKYSILITRRLNLELMKKAAKMFIGTKDFKSFCSKSTKSQNTISTIREIYSFTINKNKQDLIVFKIAANSFLYNMARIIAGTVLEVGSNQRKLESIKEVILKKDRRLSGKIVPAKGLFLTKVEY